MKDPFTCRKFALTGIWVAAIGFWIIYLYRIDCISEPSQNISEGIERTALSTGSGIHQDTGTVTDSVAVYRKSSETRGKSDENGRDGFTGRCIDVNTAGLSELDLLPGIGPALAERIIEHRKKNGRFSKPGDLMAVKGIGPVKLEKMQSHICF